MMRKVLAPNTTTSLYRLQLVREADYPYETGTLTCSATAAKFFRPLFEGIDREQMAVAFLDAKHRVIGVGIVSIGSLTASIVHPRLCFAKHKEGAAGADVRVPIETTFVPIGRCCTSSIKTTNCSRSRPAKSGQRREESGRAARWR
jgi:hypothetical protein